MLARLRAGDERAFEYVVDAYHSPMLAIARTYVKTHAVAEEVVQEAWIGVLNGLDRFEGRSTLRLSILRILVNKAITEGGGRREASRSHRWPTRMKPRRPSSPNPPGHAAAPSRAIGTAFR